MDWLKEKMLGRVLDKAVVRVNERTLWLLIAVFALVLYFFHQDPDDVEDEDTDVQAGSDVGMQPGAHHTS